MSDSHMENIVPEQPQKVYNNIPNGELIEASRMAFDRIVTRDYLHSLCSCTVRPLNEGSSYSPIRWFKINKIVKEKNTFFADKLSMLYMALHKTARNVVLVINKQNEGDIELYLGARDLSGENYISGEILEAGLNGYFPGIGFESSKIPDFQFSRPSVSEVSAIASLRDDKKEDFVQGIERLINATDSISRFRAYFIADSVSNAESKSMIEAFNNLYSSLAPAESLQMTYNETKSKGISTSVSENFSKSIGESISKTLTHTDGFSENTTDGKSNTSGTSENISRNILSSLWHGIFGGKTGGGSNNSETTNYSSSIGKNFSDSEADQKGTSSNIVEGRAEQKGNNQSTSKGLSKQITYKNRSVKYYLDILDKQLERLQNGTPFGLWSVATYFVANDSTTAQQLANIYRGSIIGEESGLETCAINTWSSNNVAQNSIEDILKYLNKSLNPRFDYYSLDVSAGSVVTSKELAIHLSLPQSSVPGVIVEERATFARNVYYEKNEGDTICLGNISHLGKEEESTPVNLIIDELTKHTFVTGSTGSGKSNTMYLLLSQLREKKKKFLVIEPAKGEYKHVFGCLEDVTVYSNTNKVGNLLKFNPFVFPFEHIDVLEHIDNLVEIFNACWPMYAAMPAVLKHSIIAAYENCGWNIDRSEHELDTPIFPKIEDVVFALKDYIDNSEYSADTKGDYKGALEVRLQELCEGMFGKMLNTEDSIDDSALFNENAIVDLSRIKSVETKALIMGFLVMKINEFRMSEGGMNLPLKHITVLEEAHNLLKRTATDQSQESSNLAGKSVEMISNSIAEMRTYGEAFIIVDQSPSALDSAAIRNTNTKIILALPAAEDRLAAGGSMSLNEEQINEIGRLKKGEAIVYQNIWEEPVQCKISLFKEYKKDYEYNKVSPVSVKRVRCCTTEMLKFLLYPQLQKSFNVPFIDDELQKSNLPTSLRFKMKGLLNEYKENGTLSVWKTDCYIELVRIVKQYLGIDAEYANIISQCYNMKQVRVVFDNLLNERITGEINNEILYYTQMCYVRNNAQFQDWRDTFK